MNPTPDTRLAAQPFVLNLPANDYTLTTEELEAQLDQKLLHKTTVFVPNLQFKSLRGNQLTLINSFREERYLLRIGIQPGSLSIRCSCNRPVETLCLHSYRALKEISHRRESYFRRFLPGGWITTALANKKAFAFEDDELGPKIKPRPPHDKIYGLNTQLPVTANLMQQPPTTPPKEWQVTYLILSFSRRRVAPILMPILCKPAKTGKGIRSFCSFPETIAAGNTHHFTETQLLLNRYCLAMLKEAEKLTPGDSWFTPEWQWQQFRPLFSLWQQCWPLLCIQPSVCYSHIYQLKFLRHKPWIRQTTPITVSQDKVTPMFELKQYPGHHRLSMHIPHNNKQLRSEAGILPFFVNCPETDCFYLLPSLAIAQLVAQMHDAVPFISVFKQQYKSFQQQVVAPLQKQKLLILTKHKIPKPKKQKPGKGTRNKMQGTNAS